MIKEHKKMIKFGTGSWRAIIAEDFIKANIQIVASAMAAKMKAEGVDQKRHCDGM